MRKIIYNLIIIFLLFPMNVFAEGYISVSPSSLTITEGSSKTITITAYNAIGDVSIKSNNSTIAKVNTSFWETGIIGDHVTKKGTITVKGLAKGTTTITFTVDGSTFDSESLSGQVKTVTVNVIEKPVDNRSKNNNLKSLEIDGYKLNKKDNNNYSLEVNNDVVSINIKGESEDSKAKITGLGFYDLKVGVNDIKIVVTAENGSKNTINVKVTRKDGYYLTDLEGLLNDNKLNELDIMIDNETKLSGDYLEKIKASNKKVRFNYFDKDKKLIYSWIIDGGKINNYNDVLTTILYESENKEIISKLSNYAEGMYLNFKHEGNVPEGTSVKVYVGDKYQDSSMVNIYHYIDNSLKMKYEEIKVVNGYIEFDIEHCSEYFVTRANLNKTNEKIGETIDLFMIISLVELFIILILLILLIKKKKNNINKDDGFNNNSNQLFETENNIFPSDENINIIQKQPEFVKENNMESMVNVNNVNEGVVFPQVTSNINDNNQNNNL